MMGLPSQPGTARTARAGGDSGGPARHRDPGAVADRWLAPVAPEVVTSDGLKSVDASESPLERLPEVLSAVCPPTGDCLHATSGARTAR